ncbi:MAG: hypothetical protein ACE141_14740 [Bryobacteraceae bacterium]
MNRSRLFKALTPGLALCLAGCVSIPDTYAPPMERKPVTGFGTNSFGSIVGMGEPGARMHIIKDVSPVVEGGSWRWSGKRPELRFIVTRTENVKLVMDFAVAKATFDATGPVTFSFFVNDQLLDKVRYDAPGDKHYEKPVPPEWLRTDQMSTIAVEIDKVQVSPLDGAALGFILSRVGFAE